METNMATKTNGKTPTNGKAKRKSPKSTKSGVTAADVAKMTKWNEKHPDAKFSWIVIGPNTPAAQQACKSCEKKFGEGRVTRLTSEGHAVCGPRCQLKVTPRPAKAAKAKKTKKTKTT